MSDNNIPSNTHSITKTIEDSDNRPMVSILTPAYNEAAILVDSLNRLYDYMATLEHSYRWELIVVNDGSKDDTGKLVDELSKEKPNLKVHHHKTNRNLGGALQTGFSIAQGDYIVVMDIDLSYSEDHIEQLLTRISATEADIVIASPYMKGGKNTAVPFLRLLLSKTVNRMMRFMSVDKIYTFTGMVRAYKAEFIKSLNLKSITYSINPEIIQKGQILRAKIEEIPAHLDWSFQNQVGQSRVSSIRIFKGVSAGLMSGFIFRPYVFFMSIGLFLFLIAAYIVTWIFINTFSVMPEMSSELMDYEQRFSAAVAAIFRERPYSFFVGGTCLIVSLQFLGIGFLSLQNKRYFDELFHINTTILKKIES